MSGLVNSNNTARNIDIQFMNVIKHRNNPIGVI